MKIDKQEVRRFLKFMFCSQLAWVCDLLTFTLLYQLLGVYEIIAKAISYAVGATVSYILNLRFTFSERGVAPLPKFIAVNLVSEGVSLLSMHILSDKFHLEVWLVYFITILFSFSINYFGNRFWVFRKNSKEDKDACQSKQLRS